VEQHRLKKLKDQLTAAQKRSLRILDRSCNKFYLVSVEDTPSSPERAKYVSPGRSPGTTEPEKSPSPERAK
jgi:hypothetical protein